MNKINVRFNSPLFTALASVLAILSLAGTAAADTLGVRWEPNTEPEVIGYMVHVGTQPGTYSQHVDVGPETSWYLTGAVAGQQYCFAISAYAEGVQGPLSNEICGFSNAPPVLANPGTQTAKVGEADTLQLGGSDPDGNPVTYSATGLPPGLTLMQSAGFISGTPTKAGSYSVTIQVSDSVLTASQVFTWQVSAADATKIAVSLAANRPAPQPAGTAITFTANATGGTSPYQYKWWVFDGTTWNIVQNWSASSTFTWQPATANTAYMIGVWVRNAGSTVDSGEYFADMPFAITAPPAAIQVALTANRPAPQPAGTAMTFTASATGGTSPYQYKWWVFDGTTWNIVQNWSASSTFTWQPATANAAYQIGVWVRNAGSTVDSGEYFADMPFAVTAAPAKAIQVTLTADRQAPQPTKTRITFTATATGGSGAYQYKYWVYDGVSWKVLANWSTNARYTWRPMVANAAYTIRVWVRNASTSTDTAEGSETFAFPIR